MAQIDFELPAWLATFVIAVLTFFTAFLSHWIIFKVAVRLAGRTSTSADELLISRLRRPLRWFIIALALTAVQPALNLPPDVLNIWSRLSGLIVPGLLGWIAIGVLGFVADFIKARADISVADNLRARRQRTRADILHRIGVFVILLVTLCMMLMTIPSVRNIGVTLIASAGLAALAVGAAAQPALKNLVAGFQMAFTEPIRIDDVVIIEGEWGRIEEIRLTYVVVKIWDERRLVVPVSKFLEDSFENWTRQASQITGSVMWYLDPSADVARLRGKVKELVSSNPNWDQRFYNLQVTDAKPEAIEVRALMTASDASAAFDLRCEVREALLDFIRAEMPEALVRYRGELLSMEGT